MTQAIICPNCQNSFSLPADHVGAKAPCPRCENLVAVPGGAGSEDVTAARPSAAAPRDPVEAERDEDAPPAKGFKPCPRCGADGAKRILWAPWGSFFGPALLCHVRCPECRCKYNGRTGRSNLIPVVIFATIPTLIILVLLAYIAFVLYRAMF
jgi:DNA-directed RNA polymerase subunit M/transcription elongation factor TFIIS